jgi:hypothetical protein
MMLGAGSGTGIADEAYREAGKNEPLSKIAKRRRVTRGYGIDIINAFMQSVLYQLNTGIAVIFTLEFTGEDPVGKSIIFTQDIAETGLYHDIGRGFEDFGIEDNGVGVAGLERDLEMIDYNGGDDGSVTIHRRSGAGNYIRNVGLPAKLAGKVVYRAGTDGDDYLGVLVHLYEQSAEGLLVRNEVAVLGTEDIRFYRDAGLLEGLFDIFTGDIVCIIVGAEEGFAAVAFYYVDKLRGLVAADDDLLYIHLVSTPAAALKTEACHIGYT